jgi:hypothetical protein
VLAAVVGPERPEFGADQRVVGRGQELAQRPVGLDDAPVEGGDRHGDGGVVEGAPEALGRRCARGVDGVAFLQRERQGEHAEQRDHRVGLQEGDRVVHRRDVGEGPDQPGRGPVGTADQHDARPRDGDRSEAQRGPHHDRHAGEHDGIVGAHERHRDTARREHEQHGLQLASAHVRRRRAPRERHDPTWHQQHAEGDRDRGGPRDAPELGGVGLSLDRDRRRLHHCARDATDHGRRGEGAQLTDASELEQSARVPTEEHRGGERSRRNRERVADDELDRRAVQCRGDRYRDRARRGRRHPPPG